MGSSISTFANCLAEGQTILAWCRRCDRRAAIDVAGMVAAGRGDETMIGPRWRCSSRGQPGTITVHQTRRTGGFWG